MTPAQLRADADRRERRVLCVGGDQCHGAWYCDGAQLASVARDRLLADAMEQIAAWRADHGDDNAARAALLRRFDALEAPDVSE